jgi:hypothetical protein
LRTAIGQKRLDLPKAAAELATKTQELQKAKIAADEAQKKAGEANQNALLNPTPEAKQEAQ